MPLEPVARECGRCCLLVAPFLPTYMQMKCAEGVGEEEGDRWGELWARKRRRRKKRRRNGTRWRRGESKGKGKNGERKKVDEILCFYYLPLPKYV